MIMMDVFNQEVEEDENEPDEIIEDDVIATTTLA